jgi:hypothetical protein
MPFSAGYSAFFEFAGVDISASVKDVKLQRQRKELKLPRIGGNQVAKIVGPVDNTLRLTGWIEPTVTNLFTADQDVTTPPVSQAFVYGPQGNVGGLIRRTGQGFLINYDEDTDAENGGMWTAEIAVDGLITSDTF